MLCRDFRSDTVPLLIIFPLVEGVVIIGINQNDILGIIGDPAKTGKSAGNDIRKGKSTVIVCHALKNIKDKEDLDRFESILGKMDASEDEIEIARNILKRTGSIDYAIEMAEKYTKDAISKLDCLKDSKDKEFMIALAEYAMSRDV